MQSRHWFRPPRQPLLVFLAVAILSAAALGWLFWLLLRQDAALDVQRRQDSLEQAADRAAAAIQRSLSELQSMLGATDANPHVPVGVAIVSMGPHDVTVRPERALLYYPMRPGIATAPAEVFAEGEHLEFGTGDLQTAAATYRALTSRGDPAVRAGALLRLARVRRKLGDADGALQTYDRLESLEDVALDGLPADLVARVGRASIFSEAHRDAELRREAAALQREMATGRWHLLGAEYDFYSGQASAWLGGDRMDDSDARVRSEVAVWVWTNRESLPPAGRRPLTLPSGAAFVTWQIAADRIVAAVAGPAFLSTLCAPVPAHLRCTLTDSDGRSLTGAAPVARASAVRTATASGLPWTLYISSDAAAAGSSPRRRLLMLVFAVVTMVLMAGWYLILRAMSRELRVARLQNDFVAAVSHEFRSPLTSLSHIAEMLATDRLASESDRRESFQLLARETDRLCRLVEGLLDFGRFQTGAAALRLELIDIAELVRSTAGEFQERVAREGYSVEINDAAGEVYVHADREALSRALWNLLDNAVKYSPDCRTVWVDLTRHNDDVSIVVRDQGLGIPVDEQREIFDRFVRGADSTARRIKGTGIGLAMVRDIVTAHGGEVRVASEPGRGSRFTMVLHPAGGMP
jgi:signal transduction histidine kinase